MPWYQAYSLADGLAALRGILRGGVHADAGVGGAGAAGDEADAGLAGEFAVRLGHVGGAAFLAADHGLDGVLVFIERVDAGQVTFAGHQENAARAVVAQLLDEDLAAVACGREGLAWGHVEEVFRQGQRWRPRGSSVCRGWRR